MPTLQEILDDVDVWVPNTQTIANKIKWLNSKLNEPIIRNMTELKTYDVDTVAGQATYSFDTDMEFEGIEQVKVSTSDDTKWTEYTYAGLNDTLTGYKYYNNLDGKFGLFPIPTVSGYHIRVTYRPIPTELSINDTSVKPNLIEKYHNMLKYYLCQLVASTGNNPDVDIANYYEAKYQEAYVLMHEDWMKTKAKNPKKKDRSNSWW